MLNYILRRMLLMIPTLFGVMVVVFFVMALAPGGFGGSVLSQHGTQTEGDEARRIREYFNRRYGLDRPAAIQFGRWLNQVSPLGFRTSSKTVFGDEATQACDSKLRDSPVVAALKRHKQAVGVALALAAYEDSDPAAAADLLVAAVTRPREGMALLGRIHEQDAPTLARLEGLAEEDPQEAGRLLLDGFDTELAGRDRILFRRPTFKWPDLGTSLRGRPVLELLAEAAPITILLNVISIPIIYSVSIFVGIYAARHRGKLVDVGSGAVMLGLWSIPVMWVGVMLIGYLASKQYLWWFPTAGLHDIKAESMSFLPQMSPEGLRRGWLLDALWHLVLPIFCLSYGGFAVLAKLSRGAILENIASDYVRTARAKGVGERDVLFRHVLRNSLLPMITVAAAILPALFVGSVIVETIFSIPGMGKLGVDAAFMKDREIVMGTTLVGGMIGLLSELTRDVCYAVADPRVSYE